MALIKYFTFVLTKLGFNRRRRLSYGDVNKVLLKLNPGTKTIQDTEYRTYGKKEVKGYYDLTLKRLKIYVPDLFDCDDFALGFMMSGKAWMPYIPLGVAHITYTDFNKAVIRHALNFFIDQNLDVWFLEPQTGVISPKQKKWRVDFMLI